MVNPFGPKVVPQPDLTKVKPLVQPLEPIKPVKQDEDKIDRGKVKVEVEGQKEDVGNKKEDLRIATETTEKQQDSGMATSKQDDNVNKKTTYDDLFGN